MLCKLVGVHLARGDSPDAIEPLALAWAEKCSPPLPEVEVLRTLNSLTAKHQRTTSTTLATATPAHDPGEDIDLLPLPAAPRWPVLHADALHGLAGELIRTLEPHTEADPVGLLLTFLACFGSVVGRGPFFAVEGDRHHGNLFVVLVGKSSRGRKGTSLGRILSLFDPVAPAWKQDCISTGLSSGEGLIHAVRDPVETAEPVKEKGKIVGYQAVVRDQGVTDKRLLVSEPEFAQALKVMKREGNTLSPVIRQAWDSGSLAVLTKNHSARATDAHVAILGHITRPELTRCLDDSDCWNGFANRILWALVRRSKLLPEGGEAVDLSSFQQRLGAAVTAATAITRMSRSAEARALWHDLYPQLTAERHGLVGAVTGRGEAQTLRLSMLFALLDGQAVIDVPHLRAAVALWDYCQESAQIIFTEDKAEQADPLEKLLLQKIQAEPGINRRGLHKVIGGHVPASLMIQALATLRDQGRVRAEMRSTGGRPSECWFPCEQTNKVPLGIPGTPAAGGTASERAKSDHSGPAAELCSFARTAEESSQGDGAGVCSFARPEAAALTLPELFNAVNALGGRLERQGDKVVVAAAGKIPRRGRRSPAPAPVNLVAAAACYEARCTASRFACGADRAGVVRCGAQDRRAAQEGRERGAARRPGRQDHARDPDCFPPALRRPATGLAD
jgi:hypothetical protein